MLYATRSILIEKPYIDVFNYIANPKNLPNWTNAFASANDHTAKLNTPQGQVAIGLDTQSSEAVGNVDWLMTFPDKSIARAFSRVLSLDTSSTLYSFVLTTPPSALEDLEGTLKQQTGILEQELKTLKAMLER